MNVQAMHICDYDQLDLHKDFVFACQSYYLVQLMIKPENPRMFPFE